MSNFDFDARDILLDATADVQEIIREILADLTASHVKGKIAETWAQAPEEMKEQFAQERPAEYAELMKTIGKERKVPYGQR